MVRHACMFSFVMLLGLLTAACNGSAQAEESQTDEAAEIAKQVATYPLQTCVISGEKLGSEDKPVDYMYEGRLVRFCCKGCIKKFKADPQKYLKILDEAAAKEKATEEGEAEKKE